MKPRAKARGEGGKEAGHGKRGAGRTPGQGCPICGKAVRQRYRPFCSKRCADIDLGRWLGERYAIPAEPVPPEADEEGGAGGPP